MSEDRKTLLNRIRAAPDPEPDGDWPTERLTAVRDSGVLAWGLPDEYGGVPCAPTALFELYRDLSQTCLTTAFILTQREAACQRIAQLAPRHLQQRWLPGLIRGQIMATVGISHLSTSRQHWSQPSVRIIQNPAGYILTGEVPWVTGGCTADLVVTGGVLDSGEQLLVALPTRYPGVRILPALPLTALRGSSTGSLILDNVTLDLDARIAGPAPTVMSLGGSGGTGSLITSVVALGASLKTLDQLRDEAAGRPDILRISEGFAAIANRLWTSILQSLERPPDRAAADRIRAQANALVSRAALALVTAAKGRGFVAGHPAERAVRESLFFQVWSCPPAVSQQTLAQLANDDLSSIAFPQTDPS